MIFKNRFDAAMKLLPFLEKYRNDKGVVLAIPRGGVPIAYYIAQKLNFNLDLLLTKKIGHPLNNELAIGAVSLESEIINPGFQIAQSYITAETARIRKNLQERYNKFMGDNKPVDIAGRTVIIVDDGVATGSTMLAAVAMIRHKKPKRIIIVIPVAAPEAALKISEVADELVCLSAPKDFMAVGQFYEDFSEVTDEEVLQFLNEIRSHLRAA